MIAGTLEFQLLADLARLKTDMDKATGIFTSATRMMEGAARQVKEALIGMVGALSVGAFIEAIKQAVEYADQLYKLSQRTGIATEALSELAYAAKQNGLAGDVMTVAIKKLNVSIDQSLAGNRQYAQAFSALGVSLKDAEGKTITADKALLQIADRFRTAPDGPIKTAYAVQLMGRAGDEAIPLLNKGSAAILEMMNDAKRLGIAISADFAKQAEEFNTNLTVMKAASSSLAISLGKDLVEALGKAANAMAEAAKQGGAFQGFLQGFRTLFTGDDLHKANVEMSDAADNILRLQGLVDGLNAKGPNLTEVDAHKLEQYQNALADQQARYNQAAGYAHMLAPPGKTEEAPPEQKPLPPVGNPGAASAIDAIVKNLQKRNEELQKSIDLGRQLNEQEKFDAGITAEIAKLKKEFPGINTGQIEALVKQSDALFVKQQALAAELHNSANYAKEWAKEEEELAQHVKAQADARDRINASLRDQELALKDSRELLEAEGRLIGASERERETALGQLQAEQQTKTEIRKLNEDLTLTEEARNAAIAKRQAIGDEQKQQVAMRAELNEQTRIWQTIDQTARDVFMNIWTSGRDTFTKLRDTLKNTLLELLYQLVVKKWIVNIVASVTGGSVGTAMGSIADGLGGLGGTGSMTSALGGLGSLGAMGGGGALGMFGQAASTTMGNGLISGFSTNMANIGSLAAGGEMMGALGAAMPYLGAAMLVASALGAFSGGHGPKTEMGTGLGVPNVGDASALRATMDQIQQQYGGLVKGLGGSGGPLSLGIFSSQDPNGTARTQLAVNAALGGNQFYSRAGRLGGTENVARDPAALQAAIAEEIQRVVLGGLQQSNVPGAIGKYIRDLGDIDKLGGAQLTEALTRVQKAMTEKQQLEAQILTLTSTAEENLARQRQAEIDAVDDTNKALVERVHALQDEQTAAQSLRDALSKAKDSAKSYSDFISTVNGSIRQWINSLSTSESSLTPEARLQNANAVFAHQYQLAQAGDRGALGGGVTSAADALIAAQRAYTGNNSTTTSLVSTIVASLKALPEMKSDAQFIVDAITSSGQSIVDGLATVVTSQFDKLDTNVDGLLDFGELKAGLNGVATDDQIRALIAHVDLNGDGMISKTEAAAGAMIVAFTDTGHSVIDGIAASLQSQFGQLDANVDGLLTFGELKAGLGGIATDDQIHALISRVDANGDGMIDKQEATRAGVIDAVNANASAGVNAQNANGGYVGGAVMRVGDALWNGLWGTAGMLHQDFGKIDTNMDGLLSFDELKVALGPLATDDTIHKMIAAADTNGDGQISQLEAIKAAVDANTAITASMGQAQISATLGSGSSSGSASGTSSGAGSSVETIFSPTVGAAIPVAPIIPPNWDLVDSGTYYNALGLRSMDPTAWNQVYNWLTNSSDYQTSLYPGHAGGGLASGWSWVGERGPELAYFGQNAMIYPHDASMLMAGGAGGGDSIEVLTQVRDMLTNLIAVAARTGQITEEKLGQIEENTGRNNSAALLARTQRTKQGS